MPPDQRKIFLVNGKRRHWEVGRENKIWGFSLGNQGFARAKSNLQKLDFRAGTEILAISGPYAHFRAVVGSDKDVFFDNEKIYWLGNNNEIYPVRFELTKIQNINQLWFQDQTRDKCLTVLEDVYFVSRSLFRPDSNFYNNPSVDLNIVYGTFSSQPEPDYVNHERLEEDYRNKFVKQFNCDDGHTVRSLSEKDIDNWLWNRGIAHAYEPVVTIPEPLIPDFKIKNSRREDVYIEFWGMTDDPIYEARMKRKQALYSKYNLIVIEVIPEDLQNLDFRLSQKLMNKGVVVPH